MPEPSIEATSPTQTLNPDIFERNLCALSVLDPQVAIELGNVDPAASGWMPTTTRDGRLSFQRTRADGTVEWLGRSSLPHVRAEALLEKFDSGRGNVFLLEIAAGTEAVELLIRMGCHRAIFVLDDRVELLSLVLRLHDFSEAITSRRLILLTCPPESVGETLLDWLRRHAGHLCPERILMWPWQEMMGIAELRTQIESVYHTIQREREEELARLRQQTPGPTKDGAPAIFALHAREEVWACAEGLAAAWRTTGADPFVSLVRGPGDIHTLGRARARAAFLGGPISRAILLDITRTSVRDLLPDDVPAVSWLSPLSHPSLEWTRQMGPNDRIAVTTHRLLNTMQGAGLAANQLYLIPPPCLSLLEKPLEAECRAIPVAMITDLSSTEAESYGVQLPTHMQIWNVALDLIKGSIEGFNEDQIDGLLQRAEQKSGLTLEETTVRQTIREGLRSAAHTLVCRFFASVLETAGIQVQAFGRGWEPTHSERSYHQTPDRHALIIRSAVTVLHIDLTGDRTADALLAAGGGASLVSLRARSDKKSGGLATLLQPEEEYLAFGNARELVEMLKKLRQQPVLGQEMAARALERCRRDHTPAQRLRTLESTLSS